MSRKTGDQYAVPVCRTHHTHLHEAAMPERVWWAVRGINPITWAENEYKNWMKNNGD